MNIEMMELIRSNVQLVLDSAQDQAEQNENSPDLADYTHCAENDCTGLNMPYYIVTIAQWCMSHHRSALVGVSHYWDDMVSVDRELEERSRNHD